MKITKKGLVACNNEPVVRSCWKCNGAHTHLKTNENILFLCYDCGSYFAFKKRFVDFKSEASLLSWLQKKIKEVKA